MSLVLLVVVWVQVRYTREAQVDGTILEQLAQVPLQQVEQMATATKR